MVVQLPLLYHLQIQYKWSGEHHMLELPQQIAVCQAKPNQNQLTNDWTYYKHHQVPAEDINMHEHIIIIVLFCLLHWRYDSSLILNDQKKELDQTTCLDMPGVEEVSVELPYQ